MPSSFVVLLALSVPLLPDVTAMRRSSKTVSMVMTGPPLCDEGIVEETCKSLNDGEESSSVAFEGLRDTLSATSASVDRFWGQHFQQTSVPCLDLCQSALKTLKDEGVTVPDSSDVGCYMGDDGKSVCDLDLSMFAIQDMMKNKADIPDFPDRDITKPKGDVKEITLPELPVEISLLEAADRMVRAPANPEESDLDMSLVVLATRIAELFRIHPQDEAIMKDGSSDGSALLETRAGWRQDVARRNQQAQTYITNALNAFRARRTGRQLDKWFGAGHANNLESRKELLRIMNSVDALLSNVEFVYPGDQCRPNVYGYVYPRHPDRSKTKNSRGQFIFYLCDHYMKVDAGEQIETLTHEGSHHAFAFTTDVCVDDLYGKGPAPKFFDQARSAWPRDLEVGDYYNVRSIGEVQIARITSTQVTMELQTERECETRGYGRSTCEKLARTNPFQAMRNADNFCYYVQDVTDAR